MGLFQRRELPQTELPYVISVGQEHTKLIIGLGNPGKKYASTRHNIGFAVLDSFIEAENGSWQEKKALKCLLSELRIGSSRILLLKPQSYMNLSGDAAGAVQRFYKINNSDTIVVHDELDIPFGQIRTRVGGSSAGHNGVQSLIDHIGEDFGRIRIGIANEHSKNVDSADFVLQKFSKEEQGAIAALKTETISILNEAVFGGKLATETRKYL
jgi:PTH1 family peptidyl-tRNA hydrolase